MIVGLLLWLLAASSSLVIAGPLPLQYRSPFYPYFRNSTAISPASALLVSSKSSQQLPSTPSNPASDIAEANTAVVVEPVGRTIITSTQSAITFLDPKGQPLITQAVETHLSTSFFTQSSPTPSQKVSSPPSSAPAAQSPSKTSSVRTSTLKTQASSSVARPSSKVPSNGTVAITTSRINEPNSSKGGNSETVSQGIQQSIKTPSPNSTTTKTVLPTTSMNQSSGQLQGTASLVGSTSSNSRAPAAIPTIQRPTSSLVQSSPAPQGTSTNSGVPSGLVPTPSRSIVFVTQTDYTTVTPSLVSPSRIASTSISSTLPSTSLLPPPAVTITSSSAKLPTLQTSVATPTSGSSPSSSVPAGNGGGNGGSGFQYPTRSSAVGPSPTTAAPPSTASTSSSSIIPNTSSGQSTKSSSLPASSTSNTPLVVTPINPSQLFTITVTATTTQKETATATVTVKG